MINIVNLERTQDGGVVAVHWTATKTSGDYRSEVYGTKSFTPDASSEGYVAFDSLTESTVVGWFTDEEVTQIESVLDADLESQKEPQVISGLPW